MKPLLHAKISAKKFGGKPEDYIDIHDWFDQTKAHLAEAKHRLVLHNSFGIYLCEQQFGEIVEHNGKFIRMPYITISTGKQVSVRDVAEQHVIDDLGRIPTLEESLRYTTIHENMVGERTTGRRVVMDIKRLQIVD